jgi:ABC-type transporter Mla MlaB component
MKHLTQLTIYEVDLLKNTLLESVMLRENIELDFKNIDKIDIAGIQFLMVVHQNQKNNGLAFSIKNVSPKILEIFKLFGIVETMVGK